MAGIVVFFAQLLGDFEARVGMLSQEAQKIFPLHKIDLAWIDGLRGQLIRLPGNSRAESQHLARLCDLQDQRLAIGGTNRELHPALAEHKYPARRLALDKQNGPFWISRRVLNGLERLQCGGWQVTENALAAHLARQAAFYNVETVWREHDSPFWAWPGSDLQEVPAFRLGCACHDLELRPSPCDRCHYASVRPHANRAL